MKLNINTDATVKFTNKLEKLHRSALPVAIRSTLNSAAFDVKQNTMLKSAKSAFEERNKTFFKANSRVEQAKGFDTNTMKSMVGFTSNNLKGSDNFAVKDLEQQEYGGTIKGRSFIPTDDARGGSKTRAVRPGNRLQRIKSKKLINTKNIPGKTEGERFVKAVFLAGRGGFVLAEYKGNRYLWRVNSVKRDSTGKFKLTKLYTFEKNRSVKVEQTGFMREATNRSADKLAQFYEKEAKRQIKRLLSK